MAPIKSGRTTLPPWATQAAARGSAKLQMLDAAVRGVKKTLPWISP